MPRFAKSHLSRVNEEQIQQMMDSDNDNDGLGPVLPLNLVRDMDIHSYLYLREQWERCLMQIDDSDIDVDEEEEFWQVNPLSTCNAKGQA